MVAILTPSMVHTGIGLQSYTLDERRDHMKRALLRFNRFQQFILTSLVVLLANMVAVGWWVGRQIDAGVVNRTAATTALFVDSFVSPHIQELGLGERLSSRHAAILDERFRQTTLGRQIAAFNIWDPTGRIVYSTDREHVGLQFPIQAQPARALDNTQGSLERPLQDLRTIAAGLRLPELEDLTRPASLERVVRVHERRTETTAYRHAGGVDQKVMVKAWDGQLQVEISDGGPGFEPAPFEERHGHLGLPGMRERVESLGGFFWHSDKPRRGGARRGDNPSGTNNGDRIVAKNINILVVDDHPLFREGVASTLDSESDMKTVGQGSSSEEAVLLAKDLLPDVILLHIDMPGRGIHAAQEISAACPDTRVIMLTVSEIDDDLMAALKAGARRYVLKGVAGRDLTQIVRRVHGGAVYLTATKRSAIACS